jgi:uronate dehydrogenase
VDPDVILITGAAGRIGTMLRPRLARPDRVLRLLDVAEIRDPRDGEQRVTASITDLPALTRACRGARAVIHLGGIPTEAPWAEIARTNITGTCNVLEAARRAGLPRVVLASSNHAIGFHPRTTEALPADAVGAPDTYYGVSKAAGEALGALYAARYGLTVIGARIGGCRERPDDLRDLSIWLSPDDAGRFAEAALSAPVSGFRLVWAVSANTRGWFSMAEGRAIGYHPRDDAEVYAPELLARYGEPDLDAVEHRTVGGEYCGPEFDAPLSPD